MPSIRYVNQSAPFWDFIANLENGETPFGRFDGPPRSHGYPPNYPRNPQYAYRTRDSGEEAPQQSQEQGPQEKPTQGSSEGNASSEKSVENEKSGGINKDNADKDGEDAPPRYRRCGRGNGGGGGRCGGRWSGRCGGGSGGGCGTGWHRGFNGPRCGPYGPGFRSGCGPGSGLGSEPWAGAGAGAGPAAAIPFFLGPVADFLKTYLGDLDVENNSNANADNNTGDDNAQSKTNSTPGTSSHDHVPEADVFDTESAYIVHVSLPGAKKEDVGVNWDPERSELSVAGVIYRPADEELLKALALNDRKVGAFERKIRLGLTAKPASVDVDGITAKLEEGILKVEIPKEDRDYVEIKKVDIE